MKKLFFYVAWGVVLSFGLITVIGNGFSFNLNSLQRLVGLTAFSLLFVQIMLGSFMNFFTDKLGGWVFRFHVKEGVTAYALILVHPTLFLLQGQPLVVLFQPFYLLGLTALILVSMAIFAASQRTKPFWSHHWRKFHVLNYVAFFLIFIHGFFVGTDFRSLPFFAFALAAVALVVLIMAQKLLMTHR